MIEIRQGSKKNNSLVESEEIKELHNDEKQNNNNNIEETGIKTSCQPRNFRQIGTPQGTQKIYLEDYVYTYLHPSLENIEEMRVCVLVGEVKKDNGIHYIFVQGAMELPEMGYSGTTPIFTERTRETICALIKEYFDGSSLVGWYLDVKGNPPKLTPELERIHRNFFGGRDKILLMSDTLNHEEKIFACENNAVWQKQGYYIYYEKNKNMQEYMIGTKSRDENTIEPDKVVNEALKNYRELLLKKEPVRPHKWKLAGYSTCFLLMIAVCVLGVNVVGNYQKMQNLEDAIAVMADSTQAPGESAKDTEQVPPVVIHSVEANLSGDNEEENTPDQNNEKSQKQDTKKETEKQAAAVEQKSEQQQQKSENEEPKTDNTKPAMSESDLIKNQGYYIVKKGENLASISRKIYGNTSMMQAICDKNQIKNSDEIFEDQKLLLP